MGSDGAVARHDAKLSFGSRLASLPLWIGSFLCAGALHNVEIAPTVTPVALAFLMGAPQGAYLTAAAGFFVGGWLSWTPINAVYLSAAGIVTVVRFLAGSSRRIKPAGIAAAAVVSGSAALGLSKLVSLALLHELSLLTAAAAVAEAVLLVPLSRFFKTAFEVLSEASPSAAKVFCADASLMLIAAGFYPITIGYLSVGRILIVFLCLYFGYARSQERGMAAAVFLSAAMLISEPIFYFAAAGLMVGTAAAAIFARYSKLAAFFPFALSIAVFSLAAPKPLFAWTFAAEAGIAAALFIILPVKRRAEGLEVGEAPVISRAAAGLRTASGALVSAARVVDRCCKIDRSVKNAENLVNAVANEACRTCAGMGRCWVDNYDATTEDIALLLHAAEHGGGVSEVDLSPRLSEICIRPQQLVKAFNRHYKSSRAGLSEERNLRAYKAQMVFQLAAVGKILSRAAESVAPAPDGDAQLSAGIAAEAARADIPVGRVEILRTETGGATAAVMLYQPIRTKQRIELERILCKRTGMVFLPDLKLGTQRRAVFARQAELKIKMSDFSRAKRGVSADVYSCFTNYLGFGYVILADGMGTGVDAAADAASACQLVKSMLLSGCGGKEAAAYANAMLSVRDSAEAAISVDLFEINLFTGEAVIYKAGGAPSFIYKNGRVTAAYNPSLPVGIMDELCCRDCRASLVAGDGAALVSDGVFSALGGSITTILEESHFEPERAGRELLRALGGDVTDDVTLLIISVSAAL